MANTMGGSRCRFCGHWVEGNHFEGCPTVIGTKVAMAAWEYGYREGLANRYIPERQYKALHPSRLRGYLTGQSEYDYDVWCSQCEEEEE